jgi:hypothetical protein
MQIADWYQPLSLQKIPVTCLSAAKSIQTTPLLSPRLLVELRRYWCLYHPKLWLFPSPRDPEQPLSAHTAHRIFHAAKLRGR